MAEYPQQNWQWYWRRGTARPLLVLVDMSLESLTDRRGLPNRLDVAVAMLAPAEKGVEESVPGQVDLLIEQALRVLIESRGGRYAGGITGGGSWRYHYYLPRGALDSGAIVQLGEAYRPYSLKVHEQKDAEWTLYEDFLLPRETEWRLMLNRQQLQRMQVSPADLNSPQLVRHSFNFASETARARMAQFLQSYGFRPLDDGSSLWFDDANALPYGLTMSQRHALQSQQLDEITLRLLELAQRQGGNYDGWTT